MKITEFAAVLVVTALAVVATWSAVDAWKSKHDLSAAKRQIALDTQTIQAAKADEAAAAQIVKEREQEVAALNEQLVQSEKAAAQDHAKQEAKIQAIQSAKPSDLAEQANQMFGGGIRYNGSAFVVEEQTFRNMFSKAVSADMFSLDLVHAKDQIINLKAQITALGGAVAGKDGIIAGKDKEISGWSDTVTQLNKALSAQKRRSFWSQVRDSAIAGGIGYVAGRLTK